MTRSLFGTTHADTPVERLSIGNDGLMAHVLTLGAILQDVRLDGVSHSLTLGSTQLAAYQGPMAYFGAVVGPVANRISGASAVIDGQRHHFASNEDGRTTLHGGPMGTHALIWEPTDHSETSLTLRLSLPEGLGGFPGRRIITACYTVLKGKTLELVLNADTDAPTWINLANHSYWNLDGSPTIEGHVLQVEAKRFLQVDSAKLPTAALDVANTAFDLRTGKTMALQPGESFDHSFCLSDRRVTPRRVASLTGVSGNRMEIETSEPGLQVYDGARLDTAPYPGLAGVAYRPYSGLALEAQGWPDALNRSDFPSIRLDPGELYEQTTRWRFSTTG